MDHKEPFRSKYRPTTSTTEHVCFECGRSFLSPITLIIHKRAHQWRKVNNHLWVDGSSLRTTSSLRHLSFSKRTWKYFWLNIIDRNSFIKEQYYSTLIKFPSKEHEKYKTPEHESPRTRVCFIHSLQRERDKFTNFVKERLVLPNVFLLIIIVLVFIYRLVPWYKSINMVLRRSI